MIKLSVEDINLLSDYKVIAIADDTVEFTTDYGVEYHINFMADYSIWEDNAYQFVIINKNKKASPNDEKLKNTLFAIVENFFSENKNILLYICETGDGKQEARSKLFLRWFGNYKNASKYYMQDTEIVNEEESNYAALIIRRDHPSFDIIVSDFTEMTEILKNKPE